MPTNWSKKDTYDVEMTPLRTYVPNEVIGLINVLRFIHEMRGCSQKKMAA